ncbi:unnamed protein product, partial [Meganyctiphanes norvegica]
SAWHNSDFVTINTQLYEHKVITFLRETFFLIFSNFFYVQFDATHPTMFLLVELVTLTPLLGSLPCVNPGMHVKITLMCKTYHSGFITMVSFQCGSYYAFSDHSSLGKTYHNYCSDMVSPSVNPGTYS